MLQATQEGLLILVVIRSRGVTVHMIHVTWLEASRDFGDGYFVNVRVSLSFWIEQQSHPMSCFHLSRSVFFSRRSSVVVDRPTLLQTSLVLGSTSSIRFFLYLGVEKFQGRKFDFC